MRALVTGGNGFLGRYIVRDLLARGDDVSIYCRSSAPDLAAQGIMVHQGDLTHYDQLVTATKGQDVVFHVAARVGLWGPQKEFVTTNIVGTQNVIEACRSNGVRRLVFTSSPSVVFGGTDLVHADESVPYPTRYTSYYPQTKAKAEALVIAANGASLQTCSLRPHLVWGPGDNHLIPSIVERARRGALLVVGDGKNVVDFTYVENVARAHVLAADNLFEHSPVAGQCYFIGQEEPVVLWEFVQNILDRLSIPAPRRHVSHRTARIIGSALEALYRALPLPGEPRLTAFLADQLATSHYFSSAKAKRDFGYTPHVSMSEGLDRLLASFQG
ncbi:MAG: NAD-dependent epimerase/dehydratase family protein [Bdellovibrionales bacterium]|nr:NAD-dependent epimerase/dehydratase family protein [Bdellovibrionales bacterium]